MFLLCMKETPSKSCLITWRVFFSLNVTYLFRRWNNSPPGAISKMANRNVGVV